MAFKVLLVEDDNNLREIYEARLQAEGYNIVTARDGEEALGVAKAEIPDLVISDVMMPRVSGFEMLDILRNTDTLKDVKVIMLTALGQADDKTRANSLGADRYLVKSQVTLEDIVKTAHELLGDVTAEPATAAAPIPSAPPATAPGPVAAPAPAPLAAPVPVMPAPTPSPAIAPAVVPAPPVATPPSMSPAANPLLDGSQPPVVPAPPLVAPTPVAPIPSAPPFPGTTPAASPVIAPMPTPAPAAPAAPSTTDEQATVDSQINNFVQTAPDTTPVANPGSSNAQDDAVLADAMHDLAENTALNSDNSRTPPIAPEPDAAPAMPEPSATPAASPEPLAAPPQPLAGPTPPAAYAAPSLSIAPRPISTPTTSEPPARPADKPGFIGSVPIANKKIIQPLNSSESKPDIHELAAREEANAAAPGMTPPPAMTFSPSMPTPPVPPAGPVVGGPGEMPAAPQLPQTPPANPGGFDPNSISL